MIVHSAEPRREMTVLVIDGAEVAGEDGVREDVEDETRLRRDLGIAGTLSVRNPALRTGRVAGLGGLVPAFRSVVRRTSCGEGAGNGHVPFIVTSGLWGRRRSATRLWNPACALRPERSPELRRKQLGLFPRGEMASPIRLMEVAEGGIGLLGPAPRCPPDLAGECGEPDGDSNRWRRRLVLRGGCVRSVGFPVRPRQPTPPCRSANTS